MDHRLGPDFDDAFPADEDWGAQLFRAGHEFADNPEPRCPCVLLLDTSKSMSGEPMTSSLLKARARLPSGSCPGRMTAMRQAEPVCAIKPP